MAHFKEVDYCSEEVRSMARPGFGRHGGGGVEQYVVKETFEEIDQAPRPGGHGHHGHHHGHDSGHYEARETKFEEDFNSRTGEFHERKENFLVRSD
ncbi:hypothetical protein PR202_ga08551 [Eleusine coracana subsp. coracana]|uniref:Uncharacterized protein n=1 Tax=Eleusine coracana subsp. coracana TaxID=191504 RepID=A0AAV5C2H5_ELECO|nr:hypothetical protein QOZ80_1AG0043890 [Eleusine coracana subsp. coracana]GJM92120.1 hypothetical protein PR202_ga08551 [Eleusine coracana subsp. coracana]